MFDIFYEFLRHGVQSKYLNYESTLESKPLAELSKDGELYAFKHFGFFEPMDTYREYLNMNKLYNSGNMPWKNFN